MSISKSLSKSLGGTWKYDGVCTWYCNDDIRHVSRTHCGGFDHTGEAIDGPSHYWLYGDGPTKRAEEFMGKLVLLKNLITF